jgi:hypothetical protein
MAQRVRVLTGFECRRILGDHALHPSQTIVYPAGWSGLMPDHHAEAGRARGAIAIEETRTEGEADGDERAGQIAASPGGDSRQAAQGDPRGARKRR